MTKQFTFILGGARSGKSSLAQRLATERGQRVLYVATAEAGDAEMQTRIEGHRAERPAEWRTLEVPLHVGEAIQQHAGNTEVILLDCITLLANNVIVPLPEPVSYTDAEQALMMEVDGLLNAYALGTAGWVVVSNEVGLGLVPAYPLGRVYRDALGRANQKLAAAADEVLFMVSGLPMKLK